MFRRAAFEAAGRYREAAVGWEELDLFLRMSEHGRVIVLLDRLYRYRYHAMGATITAGLESRARVNAIRARCIELYLCGKDYAAELHSGEPTPAELRRALVETISTRTAMQVWSGDRPVPPSPRTVLTGRLSDAARAAIYGWAGYVSPKGVRAIARNYGRIRDQAAARKLGNKDAVEWNFGRY
ncbi:MAG: glycosyltransferase family 2 protein, partial [Actinomycetota bacterium]